MSCILKQHDALKWDARCDPDDCPLCGWDSEEAARRLASTRSDRRLVVKKPKKSTVHKLDWDMVREIRASDLTTTELSRKYGVHPSTIKAIRSGK